LIFAIAVDAARKRSTRAEVITKFHRCNLLSIGNNFRGDVEHGEIARGELPTRSRACNEHGALHKINPLTP